MSDKEDNPSEEVKEKSVDDIPSQDPESQRKESMEKEDGELKETEETENTVETSPEEVSESMATTTSQDLQSQSVPEENELIYSEALTTSSPQSSLEISSEKSEETEKTEKSRGISTHFEESSEKTATELSGQAPIELSDEVFTESSGQPPVEGSSDEVFTESSGQVPTESTGEAPTESIQEAFTESSEHGPAESIEEAFIDWLGEVPTESFEEIFTESSGQLAIESPEEGFTESSGQLPTESAQEAFTESAGQAFGEWTGQTLQEPSGSTDYTADETEAPFQKSSIRVFEGTSSYSGEEGHFEEEHYSPKELSVKQDSLVYFTKEDDLFKEKTEEAKIYPLNLTWCYGWNSSLPVYNMRDEEQRVVLYTCSHTVVLFDVLKNNQFHLQGHSNVITCMAVSEDRRWIATADKGPQCLVIVWDCFSGIPVHTIFDSCPDGNGIKAIAMTNDAKFIVTIDDQTFQKVCIWRWTVDTETPACSVSLEPDCGIQDYIIFNPANYRELVSNSKTQLVFYEWDEAKGILEISKPVLTEKTFNKIVGKFSQSVFHFVTRQVLSATMEGKLVVWDLHPPPRSYTSLEKLRIKACKLVHLQQDSLTVLTAVDSYFVTGDIRGHIRFYDYKLSLVNWYSQFKLSPIKMLSFSKDPLVPVGDKSNFPSDCTLPGDPFMVRNFIIGTSDAKVFHLTTDGTKLEEVLIESKEAIHAIDCHPYKPLIAIGAACGLLKVWNYKKKMYVVSRIFEEGLGIQSLAFNLEGFLLGAGFTEGTVYIMDAVSLKNEAPRPFKYSKGSVTLITFSHDSQFLATADIHFTVAVYKIIIKDGEKVWEYLARLHSHNKKIQSLMFGVQQDNNEPRLLSLGKDRLLIEYDLVNCHRDHLEILDIHRTDQEALPNCMVWYPPITRESFLLICNTGYKVKLFNSTTKMCRKTLIGPTYGSPIQQVLVLPPKGTDDLKDRYLAFINKDKVGLQILPVDGNPHKTSAIICHPDGVSKMTLSYDGTYVFTAGGDDHTVLQWEINLEALEAAVYLGGEDLTPFYGLLDGGREGEFYKELEDYFYYSQLRSQGIDTMETRKVSTHISLSELPFVMRAIGFYPSEEQNVKSLKAVWRFSRECRIIAVKLEGTPVAHKFTDEETEAHKLMGLVQGL
ncbi:cilia- and flagella-associated protein 251 [Gracilinanus agilis]|uniref:cilia- and flagella-associated protein 251 n=1 Tax=Gracilinanus agilis TaxID=191870 RepID=UPI001CFD4329|nr:cilia- and flagella-associated protein 251 [Gracilinanus agilis]